MKISESFNKINNQDKNLVIESFKANAIEYASQGFDEDLVSELLQADGCERDLSKKIAGSAMGEMPEGYTHTTPPKSSYDVKSIVEASIRNAEIEDLEKAISNKQIIDLIKMARSAHSEEFFDQALRDVLDIVDGMILDNTALANTDIPIKSVSDQEKAAENTLGTWSANSIRNFIKKEAVKKDVIKRTRNNDIPIIM